MTKPRIGYHAWKIDSASVYDRLAHIDAAWPKARKLSAGFTWQGKIEFGIGSHPQCTPYTFEVKVSPSFSADSYHDGSPRYSPHRIHVRCPHCHSWIAFSKLHVHILSKRCVAVSAQSRETSVLKGWDHV